MQKTLNRAKLAESLRELVAAGCPVDTSVADAEDRSGDVEINQVGESMVFELPYGGTGYILDLEFINQTSRTIYCSEPPELRMPWEDSFFDWMPDPKENPRRFHVLRRDRKGHREFVDETSEAYWFSGGGQLEYPRDLVLNHRLFPRGILVPGRPLSGLLLAIGGPMPAALRHGQWLEPTLSLISSRHVEYKETVRLWVDRSQAKPRPERKYNLRGEPVGTVGSPVAVSTPPGVTHDSGIGRATSVPGVSVAAERIVEGTS